MSDEYSIPQSVRFTIDDKLDYAYFHSKVTKENIHSRKEAAERIASNQDLNTARELVGIQNAADEISESTVEAAYIVAEAIEESTNRITGSQNRNTDRIVDGLGQIYTGIEDLKALFDWKLSEMIWILEQQNEYFKKIIEVLQKPITTQAKELRDKAEYAYKNILIPEAINDFEESIKLNPYDFACYLSLGNIYLFQKGEPKKALEYYRLAVRYAKPQSNYYTSFALLHVGQSDYILGNYEEAYDATSNAIKAYPKLSEAYYQHAKYCSKLGKYPEALSNLRKAIEADRRYCEKILSEEDFVPMSSQLKYFFEGLTNETKNKANAEIEKASHLITKFKSISALIDAEEQLEKGITLKNVGNYLSYRDAIYKAYVSQKMVVDSLILKLTGERSKLESRYIELKKDFDRVSPQLERYRNYMRISGPFVCLSFLGSIVLGLISAHNTNYIFYIPSEPFSFILFLTLLISILVFIYSKIKYWGISPYPGYQEISYTDLESLDKMITKNRQIMGRVQLEKEKLNIDKRAEKLNYKDYEKYLLKNYG